MWYSIGDLLYFPTILIFLKHIVEQCPQTNGSSSALLFFPETNECYQKESTGPCGKNMKLYPVKANSNIGECDCDRDGIRFSRMLLYHQKANECFLIFQQGPCKSGKWADITVEGTPICKPNPCYNNTSISSSLEPDKGLVLLNGTCVEVGATSVCKIGYAVGFEVGKRLPRCIRSRGRSIAVPRTRCSPGTYRAVSGRCQPAFDFD
ncbi:hypothetical protein Ocin01_04986 [Orchesella cincta]|uniref:DUF4789 domain-containing protein n=1 Tax=Orchesella cincta TaxID=48709 RepID=A0A1D2N8X9_ORCCI|nr:hypothetical protein Ocin01_04986 [Orchesella cincta]